MQVGAVPRSREPREGRRSPGRGRRPSVPRHPCPRVGARGRRAEGREACGVTERWPSRRQQLVPPGERRELATSLPSCFT